MVSVCFACNLVFEAVLCYSVMSSRFVVLRCFWSAWVWSFSVQTGVAETGVAAEWGALHNSSPDASPHRIGCSVTQRIKSDVG